MTSGPPPSARPYACPDCGRVRIEEPRHRVVLMSGAWCAVLLPLAIAGAALGLGFLAIFPAFVAGMWAAVGLAYWWGWRRVE